MFRYVISTLTACAFASVISVFAQEQTPAQPQKESRSPPPRHSPVVCKRRKLRTEAPPMC